MKVYLCGERGCCPCVDIHNSIVTIGEGTNMCTLRIEEWNQLKEKIQNKEI
ncbi:MAG: hypothetical protein V1769_00595 [Thermoplasmatota archaeon]|jgi:hypothetical protein